MLSDNGIGFTRVLEPSACDGLPHRAVRNQLRYERSLYTMSPERALAPAKPSLLQSETRLSKGRPPWTGQARPVTGQCAWYATTGSTIDMLPDIVTKPDTISVT